MKPYLTIPITRGGVPLAGSPFQARIFLSAFAGQRHEVEPDVTKTQTSRVLTFQNIAAPVQVGDIATLPKNVIAKIQNVRQYTRTLQCDLQIIPYQTLTLWTQTLPAARNTAGNMGGALYVNAGFIQGYIDPMADLMAAMSGMNIETRTARLFTVNPIPARCCIHDGTDYWLAKTSSQKWPVTNDFACVVEHQVAPPMGVL